MAWHSMPRHDPGGQINSALLVESGNASRRVRSRNKNPSHSRTPLAPPDQRRRAQHGRRGFETLPARPTLPCTCGSPLCASGRGYAQRYDRSSSCSKIVHPRAKRLTRFCKLWSQICGHFSTFARVAISEGESVWVAKDLNRRAFFRLPSELDLFQACS